MGSSMAVQTFHFVKEQGNINDHEKLSRNEKKSRQKIEEWTFGAELE